MASSDNLKFSAFDSERLSHSYIAGGSIADTIAMAAVCCGHDAVRPCLKCAHCDKASRHIHPDITVVDKPADKRDITVDQIRELKKDVVVIPCESDMKAYIINNADLMNRNAQNAFLQILEEPPSHAVFILKTENPAELLPTVRSRCVEIKARAGNGAPIPAAVKVAAEFFTALEGGNALLAALMFRLDKLEKDDFADFLTAAREQASQRLRGAAQNKSGIQREVLSRAEKVFIKAGEMLALNVNAGHISGMICASLIES